MTDGSARFADNALREWYQEKGAPNSENLQWDDYDELVKTVQRSLISAPSINKFQYVHPKHLQHPETGLGKPYQVYLAYSDTGEEGEPIIAVGGLINTTHRFDFLAVDAQPELRVISLDLSGRGNSGWLTELSDYHLDTYVEQLTQLMDLLKLPSCSLLGSSLGGAVAIRFAARNPQRVNRIVLNDSSPFIPAKKRKLRSIAIARHYVFSSPWQLFRRTSIMGKHAGPALDAVLLHNIHNKTRWSEEDNGRVYRHDLRAMLAYREEASANLDLWEEWEKIKCPVLMIHGLCSDAVLVDTIDRMRLHDGFSVLHVENTGHTPTLSDGPLIQKITHWVLDDRPFVKDHFYDTVYQPERILFPNAQL